MILDIIQLEKKHFYDKQSLLRRESVPVEDFGAEFQKEVNNLLETIDSWKIAIGLSAPQVGIRKRVAIVKVNKDETPLIIVNPQITSLSGKKDTKKESCLSLPGVRGNVQRRYKLSLSYQDRFGELHTLNAESFFARVILHELDHLDGILFVDRMDNDESLEDFDLVWE